MFNKLVRLLKVLGTAPLNWFPSRLLRRRRSKQVAALQTRGAMQDGDWARAQPRQARLVADEVWNGAAEGVIGQPPERSRGSESTRVTSSEANE